MNGNWPREALMINCERKWMGAATVNGGDAGSAVLSYGGLVFGVVFCEHKLGTVESLSYVVPMHAILEDIKVWSGGKLEAKLKV
jgi:hypothetical protein